jgi:tetratricopeptide (TPR) repeat protein
MDSLPTRISKEELVLYSLSRLLDAESEKGPYTKENLSNILDISSGTLDIYLLKSKNKGFLIRKKKKFPRSLSDSLELTKEGRKEAVKIREKIGKEFLTPENHNIHSMVPLDLFLDRILDPLEEILFLTLYHSIRSFDLQSYLQMMKDLREDSNMVRILSDLQEEPEHPGLPVAGTFFRACFFGDISPEAFLDEEGGYGNVFNLLLVAEANQKQGRLEQARTIYDHLLSGKLNLTENQWVIAKTGLGLTYHKEGNNIKAIEMVRSVIEDCENKIMKAYGNQVLARIYSSMERLDEALDLYNYVVRSFDHHGIPLLSCIAYNNRGVAFYRKNDFDRAMIDWQKSIKLAKRSKSSYSEAAILTNIADIESYRGNMETGIKLLERSRSIYEQFNDLEGISGVEFNLSLVLLDMKKLDEAIEHFKIGQEIAFPLPSPYERKEREDYFFIRAGDNGFTDLDRSIFKDVR